MKKLLTITLITALLFAEKTFAQAIPTTVPDEKRADMKNMLKVGVNAGLSIPTTNTIASLGVDLAYQYLHTSNWGIGLATGYTHFFGQENNGLQNNGVGLVPAAAMFRYYENRTGIYFGTDLGYGFLMGNNYVAANSLVTRPKGGVYFKPEIGYHNDRWNIALQYTKLFTNNNSDIGTQNYSVASLGMGISYNFLLGK